MDLAKPGTDHFPVDGHTLERAQGSLELCIWGNADRQFGDITLRRCKLAGVDITHAKIHPHHPYRPDDQRFMPTRGPTLKPYHEHQRGTC